MIVETPGIGQGDAAIVPFVDTSMYVMTPEFGAASQLEKIDMLDFADIVAINKFERRGAKDALRDVGRQMVRNREAFGKKPEDMPVFGTSAATFNDDGVTALYQYLGELLAGEGLAMTEGTIEPVDVRFSSGIAQVVPAERVRYLAEITETVRGYHARTADLVERARRAQRLRAVADELAADDVTGEDGTDAADATTSAAAEVARRADAAYGQVPDEVRVQLEGWADVVESYSGDEQVVTVRDKEIHTTLRRESLSGTMVPRVSLPRFTDHGELVSYFRREGLPGVFPFTAGVFKFKRDGEDPARMFAGEGDPARTNRRFHLVSEGLPAKRLSTAFDSVTLYGRDPDLRPDIYGKVGTSGVSVATLDDMKVLYSGFDLVSPTTSVSMTINGPAPTVLAFFLNTVVDQQVDAFREREGRDPDDEEHAALRAHALGTVRGTVQADILKEDQGQNTCLFSTEFSLRMMADIQEWFIEQKVRNFYSVSISGYHIAEAGANPISQLAFTLANGFTYVEAYLARGMDINDFAPNLSFFFSNGMDPEYNVLGRVARRIWAVAMKEKYGADERAQKLKYHVQTSGRSLHAQEMSFNDIRTTLQALIAIYDNANSLHTNAYDEAVTTPTDESVRRALAIQMIINREWGMAMNENPLQGSFVIDELTDLVEAAVLARVRRHQRARRRARARWRRATSAAASRTSRCSTSSASTTAACRSSASTPSASPHPENGTPRSSWPGPPSPRRSPSCAGCTSSRTTHRDEADAALARLKEAAVHRREQRLRRPHGRGAGVLPATGDRGVLRGGRAVPSQRVSRLPPIVRTRCRRHPHRYDAVRARHRRPHRRQRAPLNSRTLPPCARPWPRRRPSSHGIERPDEVLASPSANPPASRPSTTSPTSASCARRPRSACARSLLGRTDGRARGGLPRRRHPRPGRLTCEVTFLHVVDGRPARPVPSPADVAAKTDARHRRARRPRSARSRSSSWRPACADGSPRRPRDEVDLPAARTPGRLAGALDHRGPGRDAARRRRSAPPTGAPTRPTSTSPGCAAPRTPTSPRSARCAPDVVVANKEENRELDVRRLREAGVPVWVTRHRDACDEAFASMRRLLHRRPGLAASRLAGRGRARLWAGPLAGVTPPGRRSRSGATRGWSSARAPSPATCCARLGLGQRLRRPHADRYPHVDLGRARRRGADVVAAARRAVRLHRRTTGPRRSVASRPSSSAGRLLTWYGPSLVTARSDLQQQVRVTSP